MATLQEQAFIDKLVGECFQTAKTHGFWEGPAYPTGTAAIPVKLMLIVSEAAEALKADRDEHSDFERKTDLLEELADVVIRTFDLAAVVSGFGSFDSFGRVLLQKMETNKTRPPKHGKRY